MFTESKCLPCALISYTEVPDTSVGFAVLLRVFVVEIVGLQTGGLLFVWISAR
jgi:hypothetical protein